MRLLALNGSPRGHKSNTRLLTDEFLRGFAATPTNQAETLDLARPSERERALAAFWHSDAVLLGFPLYTDAMPGMVKELLEQMATLPRPEARPTLLFLVQSGFPEATHTAPVARYLERLAGRLGCVCAGVVRRGGIEGVRSQPAWMTRGIRHRFCQLGEGFGRTGRLDPQALQELAGRKRYSRFALQVMGWWSRVMFWDRELKANQAYGKRLETPYASR
ncbi:MAG: NAD(P)H-dependent oxidoreductase [Polyangia bacterium]